MRQAAPSKWGGRVTKCKSGQWEFSVMASFSRRQLGFCVCEYYLNNENVDLISTYCIKMKLHRFNWLKNGCRTSRKLVQ